MTNRFFYSSVVAALCMLLLYYYQEGGTSLVGVLHHSREALSPTPHVSSACRSLFMITAPSTRSINITFLSNNVNLRQVPHLIAARLGGFEHSPQIASAAIKKILKNRYSIKGISTSDYQTLAKLLPKLLFSGNVSKLEEELTRQINSKDENGKSQSHKKIKIKLTPPFLLGKSRIEAAGGVLPYVPCLIASYSDPTAFYTCAKRRLLNQPHLWLYFMGDSKIRDLFDELLTHTDPVCDYNISYWKLNQSWPVVRKSLNVLRWTDMEATTSAVPGLRITYAFRKFNSMTPSKLNDATEIIQLRLWASGRESPPNLLVIGYSTWMMLWHKNANRIDILDFLDGLRQMHASVMPLLQKVSQRTRVLVLCQSRFRPYSEASFNHRSALTPANFDWNEAAALQFLHRRVETNPSTAVTQTKIMQDNLDPASSYFGTWWWDSGLPLNLAAHLECEELHRHGLTHHPAYRDPYLACHDPHHAGKVTNTDLVAMLLNLLCNSVLQLDQRHCCS